MFPSRVHVSLICLSLFSCLASKAKADLYFVMSSFMKVFVPFGRLPFFGISTGIMRHKFYYDVSRSSVVLFATEPM